MTTNPIADYSISDITRILNNDRCGLKNILGHLTIEELNLEIASYLLRDLEAVKRKYLNEDILELIKKVILDISQDKMILSEIIEGQNNFVLHGDWLDIASVRELDEKVSRKIGSIEALINTVICNFKVTFDGCDSEKKDISYRELQAILKRYKYDNILEKEFKLNQSKEILIAKYQELIAGEYSKNDSTKPLEKEPKISGGEVKFYDKRVEGGFTIENLNRIDLHITKDEWVDYKGIIITKAVVKDKLNRFLNRLVVGFRVNFEDREIIKNYFKSNQKILSGWHSVEKFWYVSCANLDEAIVEIITAFKDPKLSSKLLNSKTLNLTFRLSIDEDITNNLFDRIVGSFRSKPDRDARIFNIITVSQSQSEYNRFNYFQGLKLSEEYEYDNQKQGWVNLGNGREYQRVILFDSEPEELKKDEIINSDLSTKLRIYKGEDNKNYYCFPWVDRRDRFAMPFWFDRAAPFHVLPKADRCRDRNSVDKIVVNSKEKIEVKPEKFDWQIAITVDSDKKPIDFVIAIGKSSQYFNRLLNTIKYLDSRRFDWNTKNWLAPVEAENIKSINRILNNTDWNGKCRLSPGAKKVLEIFDSSPETDPMTLILEIE